MRPPSTRTPIQLFAIVALLASALGALLIARPAQAQSGLPDWETPPMYYRPSMNNFVAGGTDPINVIVYGPSLSAGDVTTLLMNEGWVDNSGSGGVVLLNATEQTVDCVSDKAWSPLDGQTPAVQDGSLATFPCPGFKETESDPYTRNHLRYWHYDIPQSGTETIYAATSDEELINASSNNGVLAQSICLDGTKPVHCLTDFNLARANLRSDLVIAAGAAGWGHGSYDLTGVPVYTTHQYHAAPQNVYDTTISTDGTVKVLCLDPANTTIQSSLPQYNGQSFCAVTPAARPISLSNLTPPEGTILPIGGAQTFKVDVGYSDELRSIASVSFGFSYTRSNGSAATVSASASAPGSSRNVGTWTASLNIPADAQLSGSAQTQDVSLAITVCDSAGACWKRNNLHYILADVRYDFVFLMDTTGSMGSSIDLAKAQASTIAAGLSSYYPGSQFGVAEFRDFPQSPYGEPGDFPFLMRTNLTSNVNTAIAATQALSTAGGGNDGPEAHLEALYQASQQFSFRQNSRRIVVLISDVYGHDSDSEPGYPGTGFTAAISALNAARIKVIGVSAGSSADSFLSQVALATGTRRSDGSGAVFPISTPTSQAPALLLDVIQSSY